MLKTHSTITAVFDNETTKCFNSLCDFVRTTNPNKTNHTLILRSIVKYADKHKEDITFDVKKYKWG